MLLSLKKVSFSVILESWKIVDYTEGMEQGVEALTSVTFPSRELSMRTNHRLINSRGKGRKEEF